MHGKLHLYKNIKKPSSNGNVPLIKHTNKLISTPKPLCSSVMPDKRVRYLLNTSPALFEWNHWSVLTFLLTT